MNIARNAMTKRENPELGYEAGFLSQLSVELYGSQPENPNSQQSGTVFLRVFAQARRKEDICAEKFNQSTRLGGNVNSAKIDRKIHGFSLRCHMSLDFRTMEPKAFMEIFPATVSLAALHHQVILPVNKPIDISPPSKTAVYPTIRPSYEAAHPLKLEVFGPTQQAPLGSIVQARSGDRANNSNIGYFVRLEDEYLWLQSFLTIRG